MHAIQELLPEVPVETLSPPVTVLLVEDDRTTRLLLTTILREQNIEVLEASRLSEADMLLEQAPDVILLDGLLPDGTGLEFLQSLRQRGVQTPVIFLSSFFRDMQSFQKLTSELKVASILHKPVNPDRLVFAIRSAARSEAAVSQRL